MNSWNYFPVVCLMPRGTFVNFHMEIKGRMPACIGVLGTCMLPVCVNVFQTVAEIPGVWREMKCWEN